MALFGWCMTGHHKNCIIEFGDTSVKTMCACECHKTDKVDE